MQLVGIWRNDVYWGEQKDSVYHFIIRRTGRRPIVLLTTRRRLTSPLHQLNYVGYDTDKTVLCLNRGQRERAYNAQFSLPFNTAKCKQRFLKRTDKNLNPQTKMTSANLRYNENTIIVRNNIRLASGMYVSQYGPYRTWNAYWWTCYLSKNGVTPVQYFWVYSLAVLNTAYLYCMNIVCDKYSSERRDTAFTLIFTSFPLSSPFLLNWLTMKVFRRLPMATVLKKTAGYNDGDWRTNTVRPWQQRLRFITITTSSSSSSSSSSTTSSSSTS